MIRNKKFILVAHCIINQNSVVMPLARAKGVFKFVDDIVKSGVGIIQLPCPEFKHLGLNRPGMSKQEYDSEEYRVLCKKLFEPVMSDIREYLSHGYEFCGIVGINESPTCSISGERGIFMEEIFNVLKNEGIQVKHFEVPLDYEE